MSTEPKIAQSEPGMLHPELLAEEDRMIAPGDAVLHGAADGREDAEARGRPHAHAHGAGCGSQRDSRGRKGDSHELGEL